ncbi:hypothetical protein FRC12_009521 [Ceratobasidium sp. 428]|nr:hypothetical protein FRC09_011863 [Ceratobasidium sp. 395]KAG8760689.1 hypothetical protein FRC12_009521 [Ceratobasidium sp. 428]
MHKTYIVVFHEDAPQSEIDKAIANVETAGGKLIYRYDAALNGFAAEIPDSHVQKLEESKLKSGSNISFIQPDTEMSIY